MRKIGKFCYHKSDLKTSSRAAVVRGKKSSWFVRVKYRKLVHKNNKLINNNNNSNRINIPGVRIILILIPKSTHSSYC